VKAKKKVRRELAQGARLTIYDASGMTPVERKMLAVWLRLQAKELIKDGSRYSTRFIARYWE
jgi:hypothetical protein